MNDTDLQALKQFVARKIGEMPATNPGVISLHQTTLDNLLSDMLISKIASVAVVWTLRAANIQEVPDP